MAKANRPAPHRAPSRSPAPAAETSAPAKTTPAVANDPASAPVNPAPAAPVISKPETGTPAEAPSQAAKPGKVRWLKMETGISGPHISLSRGDKHRFCDTPAKDGGPSEAQRLVDAGFAVDCDGPEEI